MDNEKTPSRNAEEERKPLSDRKKRALLRYLAVMFAVAFILVLLSWIIQSRNAQSQLSQVTESNSNALANAERLQNENRTLQQEKADLEKQLKELQTEQEQLEQAMQAAGEEYQARLDEQEDRQAAALQEAEDTMKKTVAAYDALAAALEAGSDEENRAPYEKAMEILKNNNKYLSDDAKQIYLALLEE